MARKSRRRPVWPLVFMMIGGALILGAALVMLTRTGDLDQDAQFSNEEYTFPEVKRVSLDDAKTAFEQGEVIFVDVRGDEYYNQERIPGAVSIPLNEVEARAGELQKDAWIITYCT